MLDAFDLTEFLLEISEVNWLFYQKTKDKLGSAEALFLDYFNLLF